MFYLFFVPVLAELPDMPNAASAMIADGSDVSQVQMEPAGPLVAHIPIYANGNLIAQIPVPIPVPMLDEPSPDEVAESEHSVNADSNSGEFISFDQLPDEFKQGLARQIAALYNYLDKIEGQDPVAADAETAQFLERCLALNVDDGSSPG